MNRIKSIVQLFIVCIAVTACKKDFLDRYPLDSVTEPVFFKTPKDLQLYVNQYYDRSNFPPILDGGRGDVDTDVYINETRVNTRFQGIRTVNNASALNYTNIRSVNYFMANYRKVEADFEDYKQYVGEAHFFRAMFYFRLLRTFGDVQWIDQVLTTGSPELYEARTPRNIVADRILADLDTAASYLPADKTNGHTRINKWIALMYQSRVALYEGSWEKYHAGTAFGVEGANPGKYFDKAVSASGQVIASGLYDIYSTGNPGRDYNDLFGLRTYANNPEVLFWTKMDLDLGIHSVGKLYRLEAPAGYGLTREMADSYLCTDGKPIAVSSLFKGYSSLQIEAEDRDPRFRQTIFTNDAPWLIEQSGNVRNWDEVYNQLYTNTTNSSATGYVRRKDYNPYTIYHHLNFEETPSIQFRYAEVLLNYIEAKAELGQATQEDINVTIKKLRDRVGMPNLVISAIETDPDWEFPDLSPLINEIRRERKVEFVLEDFRWDDIARWAAADELIVGKRPKGTRAAQFPNTPTLPVDADGFLDPFANAVPGGYGFKTNRDYLDPISINELNLNPALKQNPGW